MNSQKPDDQSADKLWLWLLLGVVGVIIVAAILALVINSMIMKSLDEQLEEPVGQLIEGFLEEAAPAPAQLSIPAETE